MLDARLSLAFSLYENCSLGCDIGTDHGFLPCQLLRENVCKNMIVTDISKKALGHAKNHIAENGLESRCCCICTDGLDGINEEFGCISAMGMGGETISSILQKGADKLKNAALILSSQTDLPLVRRAIQQVNYHIESENICFEGGRYYLFFKAKPGKMPMSEDDIRRGSCPQADNSQVLASRLKRQIWIQERQIAGLEKSSSCKEQLIAQCEKDIAYYQHEMDKMR